jgi:predicted amidohydrolase
MNFRLKILAMIKIVEEKMHYKVGFLQFAPKLLDTTYNLKNMENLLQNQTADLIVLPELATSGYVFNSLEEVNKISEPAKSGDTAALFKTLAKQNNTSYVVGFSETANGKFYNSAMLVNPDGELYVYRKNHLFFEEKIWYEPGDSGFPVFPAKHDIKIGMMICFDWIFPESARCLALNGAQIIAHPANLVLPWCQQAMITRSLENRVFSITANRIGKETNGEKSQYFTGMSQVLTPKGEILQRANEIEETFFVTEIETDDSLDKQVTDFNHAFTDRRPELYKILSEKR